MAFMPWETGHLGPCLNRPLILSFPPHIYCLAVFLESFCVNGGVGPFVGLRIPCAWNRPRPSNICQDYLVLWCRSGFVPFGCVLNYCHAITATPSHDPGNTFRQNVCCFSVTVNQLREIFSEEKCTFFLFFLVKLSSCAMVVGSSVDIHHGQGTGRGELRNIGMSPESV